MTTADGSAFAREVHERLAALGVDLPKPADASYTYDTVVEWGDIAFVSGQIPKLDGAVAFRGVVGEDRTIDDGIAAAQLCAANAIAQLDRAVGLERVARVLKVNGYVASAPGFAQHPSVIEGASKFLVAALGEAGRHARTALGVPRLPADALVEIELVVGLRAAS